MAQIHQAVLEGNIYNLMLLLSFEFLRRKNIERKDESGRTPLIIAATVSIRNQNAIIDILIERGADVNQCDSAGDSILHLAIKKNVDLFTRLVVLPTCNKEIEDSQGNSPLMLAMQTQTSYAAQMLIDKNANIEHANKNGDTPLEVAATCDDLSLLKYMKEKKRDITKPNTKGSYLTHLVATRGKLSALKYLINQCGMDPDQANSKGSTPLLRATFAGHTDIVKYLLFECNCAFDDSIFKLIDQKISDDVKIKETLLTYFKDAKAMRQTAHTNNLCAPSLQNIQYPNSALPSFVADPKKYTK